MQSRRNGCGGGCFFPPPSSLPPPIVESGGTHIHAVLADRVPSGGEFDHRRRTHPVCRSIHPSNPAADRTRCCSSQTTPCIYYHIVGDKCYRERSFSVSHSTSFSSPRKHAFLSIPTIHRLLRRLRIVTVCCVAHWRNR